MEIGGYDTIYDTADPAALMTAIMSWTGWTQPVEEKPADSISATATELFFYRSQADKDIWDDDLGPDNSMIYFIVNEGRLTVVTDGILTAGIRKMFPPTLPAPEPSDA